MRLRKSVFLALSLSVLLSSCGWMRSPSPTAMSWIEYRGWGPMANLETPYSPNESGTPYHLEMRERARHVAEVEAARNRVWADNASLRAPLARR